MKKFILLLLFVSFCGGTTEETLPPIEITTTSSTVSTTSSTTTTTSSTTTTVPETTTTTVNIEDVILPTIVFTNCPDKEITTESFELIFQVTAGNFDVNYLRYSRWKNGEYDGRVYFEKSNTAVTFEFPSAEETNEYNVQITDEDKDQLISYEIFISISDESNAYFEIEESCKFTFNNVSNSTQETIINEKYSGTGDDIVYINQYTQLVIAEITGNSSNSFFAVIPYLGEERYSSIVNTTDSYTGVVPLNFSSDNPDTLQVSAVGEWTIVIKSVSTLPAFTDNLISGTGDTVIQFFDNRDNYQDITVTGNETEQFFSIIPYGCDGSRKFSLFVTSDKYSGTIRSSKGTCYLVVKAVGDWTISR